MIRQQWVGVQERYALNYRLGKQYAIEWVLMKRRQQFDGNRVLAGDWLLNIAIVEQATPQQSGIDAEIIPAQSALDGDFPEARRAEQQIVVRIVEQFARRL